MAEYTDKAALVEKIANIRVHVAAARQSGKSLAVEVLQTYRDAVLKAIKKAPAADVVEVGELTPCDVCMYSPPSSGDGKPCAMCVARAKRGVEDVAPYEKGGKDGAQ